VLARTKNSLGTLMQDAKIYEQLPKLFALVVVACVIGFLLESVFVAVANRLQRRRKCN
jgi:ABC-type nitrate/sulfonate/bicarbonate transport system permease component